MDAPIPVVLRTTRMLLRSWNPADAPALAPILAVNVAHLGPWIPAHVATPAPVSALAERLAGFAADFAAGRAFRYALLTLDESQVLGEADLFPRAATGRVPLGAADHVELGYWLDAAATGRGYATEATRALLDVAATLPGMSHVEIRCDRENGPSAALPQRLGFHLASVEAELQIWRKPLEGSGEMPKKKYFARLDALSKTGPVSLSLLLEALTELEGLDNDEAERVCREWLKNLSAEWSNGDAFSKDQREK